MLAEDGSRCHVVRLSGLQNVEQENGTDDSLTCDYLFLRL